MIELGLSLIINLPHSIPHLTFLQETFKLETCNHRCNILFRMPMQSDIGQGAIEVQPGQPPVPTNLGMSKSLAHLVDAIVCKTYHNLTILAEILAQKDDMNRKLQIVKFVQQTRKSFIRLIALVKWANGVSKINKCTEILDFLDHQSWYFTGIIYKPYDIPYGMGHTG